jgi:hypothetical protein
MKELSLVQRYAHLRPPSAPPAASGPTEAPGLGGASPRRSHCPGEAA